MLEQKLTKIKFVIKAVYQDNLIMLKWCEVLLQLYVLDRSAKQPHSTMM